MKVKVGSRKSWEGLAESGSMEAADIVMAENNQTNGLFRNTSPSPSAPPLLALDPQKQPEDVDVKPEADENEDDDDDDSDADGEFDDAADEAVERPKLDEGFYEIESIRRKRVRKGQLQYFIKWRDWPEAANTWEPVENLQACSDFIDAFEESLLSGKRKRKRKSGILHNHVKKRHQFNRIPIYNSTGLEIVSTGQTLPCTGGINNADGNTAVSGSPLSLSSDVPTRGENVNNGEITKKANDESGAATVTRRSSGRRSGKERDPTLSELKIIPASGAEKLAIPFQEVKDSEGNDVAEHSPGVQNTEPSRSITRSIGAKRRKSGSVKRFKQEPQLFDAAITQNLARGAELASGGRTEIHSEGYLGVAGGNPNRNGGSENALHIAKIIKATGYTASVIGDVQDVEVSFLAVRSDGVEVTVNNKFLKANNPHLLINFYEQNLRYSSTP